MTGCPQAVEIMPKPNFFIIGAPKCGTTSLIRYLDDHGEVCISEPKEPHHFLSDLPDYISVRDRDAYEASFTSKQYPCKRVGEASTWYLFSKEAVPNILQYEPNAKIIAMVRNPVDMAESLYKQFAYGLEENADTFEKAWYLQPSRKDGKHIPQHIVEPARLQYKQVCSLGSQLQRLMDTVPADQLKIILFDDFKDNTADVYDSVLEFLGLEHDGKADFPILNQRKSNRFKFLNEFLITNRYLNRAVAFFKSAFGIQELGLSRRILKLNVRKENGSEVEGDFRSFLIQEFEEEIALVENLLNRDLSHWRS